MRALSLLTSLGYAVGATALCAGEERNLWPGVVETPARDGAAENTTWTGGGPLLYSQPVPPTRFQGATRARGLRPLYLETVDPSDAVVEAHGLYPLFSYRRIAEGYRWSVFSLLNAYSIEGANDVSDHRGFDLWPFYFSRQTGAPESSYRAVFPLYGSVPNRFGQDRLTWAIFPLFAKWEKNKVTTTTAPWPFLKVLRGEGNHGFELWPLFGYRTKAGAYREQFYLWPLLYRRETELWQAQPTVKQGFLPFYAAAKSTEVRSETFLWPFFGYTERSAPTRYREIDYFWPLFVQGRGEDRRVNRWAPFYTHSIVKGSDKTWIAWPLWRRQTWTDGPLRHTRRQVLYFLYNDAEQRSATNPSLPAARKTHVWPLVSLWSNGAGQKQIQALSPLEVFYPNNELMRLNYTPFFALYRYSQSAPKQTRHSLLWNLVTWQRDPDAREFHFGPLFSARRTADSRRFALGAGLVALQRGKDAQGNPSGWRIRFFDFKRRPASPQAGSHAP